MSCKTHTVAGLKVVTAAAGTGKGRGEEARGSTTGTGCGTDTIGTIGTGKGCTARTTLGADATSRFAGNAETELSRPLSKRGRLASKTPTGSSKSILLPVSSYVMGTGVGAIRTRWSGGSFG